MMERTNTCDYWACAWIKKVGIVSCLSIAILVTSQQTEAQPPAVYKVKIVNKEHPITRGVNDFMVTDEQHFVKYEKDPKYILMESVNEDGLTWRDAGASSAAGWAYDYGKGRVCYLAPGHVITALWNPEYEKIQKNAVKWLLREI